MGKPWLPVLFIASLIMGCSEENGIPYTDSVDQHPVFRRWTDTSSGFVLDLRNITSEFPLNKEPMVFFTTTSTCYGEIDATEDSPNMGTYELRLFGQCAATETGYWTLGTNLVLCTDSGECTYYK